MLKRSFSGLSRFLTHRPLCTISILLSIFNLAFGLGFIIEPAEIVQTFIYQNISELMNPAVFGTLLTVTGLFTSYSAIANKTDWTRRGLDIYALFWFFGAITYYLAGAGLLMAVALIFSALPGYISYYYKFRSIWDDPQTRIKLEKVASEA